MELSPGIRLVFRPVVFLALLLAAGYAAHVPPHIVLFYTAVAVPALIAVRICVGRALQHFRARSVGARLVTVARGRWPGNLNILTDLRREWNVSYPFEVLRNLLLASHANTVNLRIGWDDYIFTTEPEHIKLILATDFANYVKGNALRECFRSVLGTGVFNSDGDMWKFHRGATRPFFNRDRISDFEIFAHHADRAIERMKQRMRAGYAVDFQDLASRFTMDSATSFLFGSCVDSLAAPLPYPHSFSSPPSPTSSRAPSPPATTPSLPTSEPAPPPADVFTAAYAACITRISSRSRFGWVWPLFEMRRDATRTSMEVVDAYLAPIIAQAVARKEAGRGRAKEKAKAGGRKEEPETLLDELLNLTSDPKVLKDEMLNILIAGRDTTMSVLTFVVYFLSVEPSVCARLRAEILAQVGGTRVPTYEDIREMKYLRAVINETMRLYPPVPSNLRSVSAFHPYKRIAYALLFRLITTLCSCLRSYSRQRRESVRATTWPARDPTQLPLYIPAGTKVSYSVFLMHRRKDLWGPTAEVFDPDRFLDGRFKAHVLANPYCFLPFNAGPRVCLGQQFAYNEISFLLIRLLQSFSGTTLDPAACPPHARVPPEWRHGHGRMAIERFRPSLHLTMSSKGGLWVKMSESPEGDGEV
ncbi:cytochrome P450 monooxygenase pc-1 [Mycena maculata]|uniref:Cytochrome P450 monooxygenase pc-1 n=1 Tax=Mycena maculata TaxID=230809 RepID=A0AAD7I1J2_9AGAR|nr:cytochrome P450 monooxygenase pc-1 [Mycena maculata]